jgi:hypothetical protein
LKGVHLGGLAKMQQGAIARQRFSEQLSMRSRRFAVVVMEFVRLLRWPPKVSAPECSALFSKSRDSLRGL